MKGDTGQHLLTGWRVTNAPRVSGRSSRSCQSELWVPGTSSRANICRLQIHQSQRRVYKHMQQIIESVRTTFITQLVTRLSPHSTNIYINNSFLLQQNKYSRRQCVSECTALHCHIIHHIWVDDEWSRYIDQPYKSAVTGSVSLHSITSIRNVELNWSE